MRKLLYVKGSPRGERSKAHQVAKAFLIAYRAKHPEAEVDEIDLWQADLPEFDGDRAAAKMSFFGDPAMTEFQRSAWDEIVEMTERFKSADDYLFTVPLWNGGIPYKLKLYIDLLTQPGLLFGFDALKGYSGLLQGKRATVVYTSGVYAPGAPPEFGVDFASSYFDHWLRSIGIQDIQTVRFQPNIVTAHAASDFAAAREEAHAAAAK